MDPVSLEIWASAGIILGVVAGYFSGWQKGAAAAALALLVSIGLFLPIPGGIWFALAWLAVAVSVGLDAPVRVAQTLTLVAFLSVITIRPAGNPMAAYALVAYFTSFGLWLGAIKKRSLEAVRRPTP